MENMQICKRNNNGAAEICQTYRQSLALEEEVSILGCY